ncbi:MAG: phosphoribosylaminoimidazolesuccinocarboxamide synthase [Hydrogenophilus sp.]|nr:phosphoribosylaminoimidazolesuccinocarboxamide synthase [Hydrogenophilus sp.]
MAKPLWTTTLQSLPLIARGKVRDLYAVDEHHLLIIATDRLSAFDVILPDPIPDKGAILTQLTLFWFDYLSGIIPDHRTELAPESVVSPLDYPQVVGRSMVVKRLTPLPIEAVVRGYLAGSGYREYQATGSICGISLPPGLPLAAELPEPIFTPATKAEAGAHDENISLATAAERCAAAFPHLDAAALIEAVRAASLELYRRARDHARQRGIIIADTKFEFGLDAAGTLYLIDELLTPDSSRFWPLDAWRPGISPPSFDKQYIRDTLEAIGWDKRPPAPSLPAAVIARTRQNYLDAYERLTGRPWKEIDPSCPAPR